MSVSLALLHIAVYLLVLGGMAHLALRSSHDADVRFGGWVVLLLWLVLGAVVIGAIR